MQKLAYILPRLLIILLSTLIIVYLIFLSKPDGERVTINERWFEYGRASFPVARSSEEPSLKFSLLSPREIDENGEPFYWITESGDVFAVTNLSNISQSGSLNFLISNNPCKVPRDITVSTGTTQIILKVPKNGQIEVNFPIVVEGGQTEYYSLTPLPGNKCSINESDARLFVALMTDANIDQAYNEK